MRKYSRQRESIKNYLFSHHTHPTAETVYNDLKKELPNISLGTVYRNLNLLADTGEILRISSGIGPDHYDGNTSLHYHFICTKCRQILDLDLEALPEINRIAEESFRGRITNHVIHFFGQCPKCSNIKNY